MMIMNPYMKIMMMILIPAMMIILIPSMMIILIQPKMISTGESWRKGEEDDSQMGEGGQLEADED